MASLPDEIDRYCARFSSHAKDVDLCAIALLQLIGQRKRIVVIDETHRLPAFSASNAPIPTALAALFPTEVRSTGLAISYNIGAAVFGGFSPMVLTWLLHMTGNNMIPAHFCAVFFALGLVGGFMLERRTLPEDGHAEPGSATLSPISRGDPGR